MKDFISFFDHTPEEILNLVQIGQSIKEKTVIPSSIKDKTLGMLFFNPSLRTRVSFEMAMNRFQGSAISLSAGNDVWNLEFQDGVIMDGATVEHVKEGARVLSRYVDAIGIRSFASLKQIEDDLKETVLRSFQKYATVPVISMESASEHPCQALADMMTIRQRHGAEKVKFCLTWAPHVKPLPMAVPHSALLSAAYLGLDVTIAHPKGFDLAPRYLDHAKQVAGSLGGSVTVTNNQKKALEDATVVYVKSWAPYELYGKSQALSKALQSFPDWFLTADKLKQAKTLLHCLPVRRNLEVSEGALDSIQSAIIDQAENRMWVQAALLEKIFQDKN